ncbi:uncharacterized protein LOC106053682 [Biomphalaria glabrata]|uniref:Uncharacterized protein LOC106053682 n=1 Tax=Biomphalaria glabrata TaxID=6526 RepID=A0A2C9K6W1_BIOGL|nr:uncharacterized protein LOC106053682 [Biomphalaria glabrata]XP_055900385.1 uncharacterized protein LOC106053682 [Biomphalaria glabrata]XP_055900386.1 uncharacterized protein LOC106053682 [Biomphalaria glabrata]XP_055900387.1 uncharacterized protein LOC106053682 [Biomphalaria glabrata]KAI8783419.1 hypothetical protein BgiBS90_015035 [Biomphalaria glabrata]
MRTSTLITCLLVAVVVLVSQTQANKQSERKRLAQMYNALKSSLKKKEPKRQCSGFACVYTHLSHTGKSKQAKLREYLRACTMDPDCSLGRRRRSIESRSGSSLLSKLLLRRGPS